MEKIFNVWEASDLVRDDEPDASARGAMVEQMCRVAREARYPLWGARMSVQRLDVHLIERGDLAITPGWMLDSEELPKLYSYIRQMRAARGPEWNPYVVSFILDVDSSG